MAVPAEEPQFTVNRFVTALVEERLDDARDLLHHELVVHEAGGLPFSGEYSGPEGFLGLLGKINEGLVLALNPTIQYLVAGETVAMRSRMTFTARRSGKSVEIGLVEIYTVRGGQILEIEVYYQDPSAVAALLAD
jgi:ketosteroid isomerase-like protein